MGTRGPVPKRSEQRRRSNPVKVRKGAAGAVSEPPALLDDAVDPIARQWYEALAASGQSRWYEPSDWAQAQLVVRAIDLFLETGNAAVLRAVLSASSSLLVTEGDRRRLQIELTRGAGDADEEAAVAALDDYRARFSS